MEKVKDLELRKLWKTSHELYEEANRTIDSIKNDYKKTPAKCTACNSLFGFYDWLDLNVEDDYICTYCKQVEKEKSEGHIAEVYYLSAKKNYEENPYICRTCDDKIDFDHWAAYIANKSRKHYFCQCCDPKVE